MKRLPKIQCVYIAAAFFAFAAPVFGEQISLSANLDKTEIRFEETVSLTLEVRWVGDITSYRFEVFPLPETENLKVLGTTSAISSAQEQGREITVRTFQYEFQPTASGTGVVMPILLSYVAMPDTMPGQLSTQQFTVAIAEPIPEPQMRGLRWYHYLALALIVIVIVVAGVYIRKRARERIEPVKTPEDELLSALAPIKDESHLDRKLFYTRLYKLLLDYAERKHHIPTGGKMLQDIFNAMEAAEVPVDEKGKLSGWLSLADREKFSPGGGEPGDTIRLITEIENHMHDIKKRGKSEAR
ncbi:MAG: hypothetical protein JSV44_03230 [Candidatus Zixiibacteriota bacterium]|nr:MAG: hypothetical protein JSV44_03230 [candidate division Zixibacteria bacterium]